jgi:hypothetical protein
VCKFLIKEVEKTVCANARNIAGPKACENTTAATPTETVEGGRWFCTATRGLVC